MNKYAAILKAPDSEHRRHLSVRAASEDDARAKIAALEAEQVAYDFNTDFAGVTVDETDGGLSVVRLGLQPGDAERILQDYRFDDTGRIIFTGLGTGNARDRGKLAQHHQTAPYVVESLELITVDRERVQRLIREFQRLHEVPEEWQAVLDGLRERGIPLNAVTAGLYGVPLKNMFGGSSVWDWDTSTIQCTLHSSRTADFDADDFFNDASATEVAAGGGYSTGGVTLSCSAPTYDTASDQIRMDAGDAQWTSSTISATDAEVWQNTAGASSTDPLIAGVDFGATVSTTNGTFQITWDSTGIVVIDVT